MSDIAISEESHLQKFPDKGGWKEDSACWVLVRFGIREADGIPISALNLPGAHSFGETEGEAIENIKDAIRELVASYKQLGKPVPWTRDFDLADDDHVEWVNVDG